MSARNKRIARREGEKYFSSPGDVSTFLKQMGVEAHFEDLTSPAGAQGPAQFIPSTARAVGLRNVHDPFEAYGAAAKLMRKYLDTYHGDWEKALVAYNAGPGKVGGPLPGETQRYLSSILGGTRPVAGAKPQTGAQGVSGAAGGTMQDVKLGSASIFDQAGYAQAQKRSLLAGFLSHHGNPDSVLFKSGLLSTAAPDPADFTKQQLTSGIVPVPGRAGAKTPKGSGPDAVRRIFEEAERVDRAQVPYLWGGGHAAKQARGSKVTPLDCSGAVSRVLGIDPRVSGQLTKYGRPGRGKNVTIYANGEHVLMEINGHFWGTSHANPGGGAGWIPRSAISKEYLKRFVARHPPGM